MSTGHKPLIRIGLWTASILSVIAVGVHFFPREYPGLSFLESFYYTLRLFILEHDLPHFPESWPLIFILFFAPLLAISALGTAITYLFRFSPLLQTRWRSDHVIVCGVGRTGKLMAKTIKARGIEVVGVDMGPPEGFEEWLNEVPIPMIYGDFLSRPVLERAGAARARSLLFASGDDLHNLEGVVSAYGWLRTDTGPVRLLWAHIASEKLAETARLALRTEGTVGIRFFDTYHLAAAKMVCKHFGPEVREGVREITIMGFGKFGRDLVEALAKDLKPSEKPHIRVVDIQNRKKEVDALAKDLGISDRMTFMQADIQDLEMTDDSEKAFFLCTDDDIGNLAVALMLTRHIRGTHVYVRMAKWPISAIEDHLRENSGITFVNINDLVVEGISDFPVIFESAEFSDLKRSGRGESARGGGQASPITELERG
ncbi:MAG: NAD-binding protein [Desulfococcaceae bacterium]